MIVIADATRPQAVAGVMGGRDSEVTDATTDIFLEVANFNPRRIRDARRALGLSTDASYRFERGVDLAIAPRALERVANLIVLLAGGRDRRTGGRSRVRAAPTRRRSRCARDASRTLLGETLGDRRDRCRCSRSVGFDADARRRRRPRHRADLARRRHGGSRSDRGGRAAARLRQLPDRAASVPAGQRRRRSAVDHCRKRVREALVGAGLLEARPMPFVAGGEGFVRVSNPLAETEAYLRREILDTLARRAEYNLARMQGNVRLFEIGSVFEPGRRPSCRTRSCASACS